MVACSHGMRLPLCQIFEVVWMGMRLSVLLEARTGADTHQGIADWVHVSSGLARTSGFGVGEDGGTASPRRFIRAEAAGIKFEIRELKFEACTSQAAGRSKKRQEPPARNDG